MRKNVIGNIIGVRPEVAEMIRLEPVQQVAAKACLEASLKAAPFVVLEVRAVGDKTGVDELGVQSVWSAVVCGEEYGDREWIAIIPIQSDWEAVGADLAKAAAERVAATHARWAADKAANDARVAREVAGREAEEGSAAYVAEHGGWMAD
jgi:hypothetical protein